MTQTEAEMIVDMIEKRIVIDTSALDNMTMNDLIKWLQDDDRTNLEYYLGWIRGSRLMTNPNGTNNRILFMQFMLSGINNKIVNTIIQARKMVYVGQK